MPITSGSIPKALPGGKLKNTKKKPKKRRIKQIKLLLSASLLLAASLSPALAQVGGAGMSGPGAGVAGMMSDGSNAANPVPIFSAAKCDNVANDTATLQAEINSVSGLAGASSNRKIVLPAGRCLVNNVTITKSLTIEGAGQKQTSIVSPNGSTNPVFTVMVDNYWGFNPAIVQFSDLTITSQSKVDPPGVGVAHGIRVRGGGVGTVVALVNMTIDEVAGSCLYAAGGDSAGTSVAGYNFNCMLPGQYGINANSANDWFFVGGQFYGAILSNILCSGCGQFNFFGVNNYSAQEYNIYLFNAADFYWEGGSIDRAYKNGIQIDNRTGGSVFFSGKLGYSGSLTNNTYSDINIAGTNVGNVYLNNIRIYNKANSPSANKPLSNINITAGNAGYVYGSGVVFDAGNWLTVGVLTGSANMYRGKEPVRAWSPTMIGTTGGSITPTTQVGNYTVNNGQIHLWGRVQNANLAGLTGNLRIGGVPVAPINAANDFGVCTITPTGWTAPANFTWLTGLMTGANGNVISLQRNSIAGAATAETAVSEWGAPAGLIFYCSYRY